MRAFAHLVLLVLIGALAAAPAFAAPTGKSHKAVIPPPAPPSATDGLRGSLDAPSAGTVSLAPAATPPQTPTPGSVRPPAQTLLQSSVQAPVQAQALPRPGEALTGLATSSLATARITPFRSTADPAPICRAECAKGRIACSISDDLECDSHWSQCVADCSIPTAR